MSSYLHPALQDAVQRGERVSTLSLQLDLAYSSFINSATFVHNGGVFVANPDLLAQISTLATQVDRATFIVLDENKRPIEVNGEAFLTQIRDTYLNAVNAYRASYVRILRHRNTVAGTGHHE